LLAEHNVPVTEVSDYTGFPEMMDGRVKTLHPKVHGGILGRRGIDDAVMAESGIKPIDMVVVNLYPFEQTVAKPDCNLEAAIENIDIGGPSMIRGAAKNHEDVAIVVDPADYPATLAGLFAIEHDFPSVEPPPYLRQLSPELYRQECQRVQARFDEAVRLAEQAFIEELSKLIDHLTERLTGQEDGRPKVFRDTVVNNLNDFFERFRTLNICSNDQLDEVVHQAKRILQGVDSQQLRDYQWLRQYTSNRMSTVQAQLDQLMVDRPRRNILRRQPG
jgi:hypothetical protein